MVNKYEETFLGNLQQFGGSRNINDYRYCGGNNCCEGEFTQATRKQHYPYYLKLTDEMKIYDNLIRIQLDNILGYCLCGTEIKYHCYIQHKSSFYNPLLVVGSCCIKKFIKLDNITKSRIKCLYCEKPYKSTKYVSCKDCREQRDRYKCKFNICLSSIRNLERDKIYIKLDKVKHIAYYKVFFPKYKDKDVYYRDIIEGDISYCKYLLNNVKLKDEIKEYLTLNIKLIELKNR
jgi:hypothetical protein